MTCLVQPVRVQVCGSGWVKVHDIVVTALFHIQQSIIIIRIIIRFITILIPL